MHPRPSQPRAATLASKRDQHVLYAVENGGSGRHQSADNHIFLAAVEGLLPSEERQAPRPVAQVLDVAQSRGECVRHDDRLGKHFYSEHSDPRVAQSLWVASGHKSLQPANCFGLFHTDEGSRSTALGKYGYEPLNEGRGA